MTVEEWRRAGRQAEDELPVRKRVRLTSAAQVKLYGPLAVLGEDIPWVNEGQMIADAMDKLGCRTWEELELRLVAEGLL